MKIADFFIELGLSGADNVGKALGGVKNGLGDVKSMSLEAKAAILGAIYALERMMSSSAKTGTGLALFAESTGISMQKLQQWQYAAQQVGVSAEDVTSSVKGVQDSMLKMLQGGAAPVGMAMLAENMAKLGKPLDPAKRRDMDYMLHWLQEASQTGPADVMKDKLMSFGINENVFAAMRKSAFNPEVEKKAPVYSDGEIGQLNKVDVAWANLATKIKMAFGHLTAKEGLPIVKQISDLADNVFKLIESFGKLAEKIKLFEIIGEIIKGWGLIFDAIGAGVDKLTGFIGEGAKGDAVDKKGNLKKNPVAMAGDWVGSKLAGMPDLSDRVIPKQLPIQQNPNKETNVTIQNQNLNFQHDGKDAGKIADTHRKATKEAYRQLPAQAGGF